MPTLFRKCPRKLETFSSLYLFLIWAISPPCYVCLFFFSILKMSNYRTTYSFLNHRAKGSWRKQKKVNYMVMGNKTLMINQKLGLEIEKLASLRHKHHIHTDPFLLQFQESWRGWSWVTWRVWQSLVGTLDFYLQQDLSYFLSELNWVSSWLPTLSPFGPFEKKEIRCRRQYYHVLSIYTMSSTELYIFYITCSPQWYWKDGIII